MSEWGDPDISPGFTIFYSQLNSGCNLQFITNIVKIERECENRDKRVILWAGRIAIGD